MAANMLKALQITGYGLLAIFIVIVILISIVKFMQALETRMANAKDPNYHKEDKVSFSEKVKGIFAKKQKDNDNKDIDAKK